MRIALLSVVALACGLLGGCGPSAEEKAVQAAREAEARAISEFVEAAKSETARDLRDPASAQFRDLQVASFDMRYVLCGEVNAKNAMGAYAGYVPFYAIEVIRAGRISGSIAKDGLTPDRAQRCVAAWEERSSKGDLQALDYRQLNEIGCGPRDFDLLFWTAGIPVFCKGAQPYEPRHEGAPAAAE